MAGIIKRQILKHLSRFTKNLTAEQINLSTLRGEGQLTDLQLDEEALQNMLDLPTWLAITRVYCNRASIRIQWTKLKTHPICLMLDKVEIEMKTCEDPRPPNGPSPLALAAGQSEYGFAEKVVEGMFIEVGCVSIKIESHTFRASLQLWQLQSYSVSPMWQQSDLRFTRLTHPQRGEVLTFKKVTWQTLRIEADASESCEDAPTTPLRLLTNGGQLNVTLKRRTKDCMVLSSKLSFSLDELLWVLTDSQLRALISYTKSLSEAVQKSVRQRKEIGVGQVPSPTGIPPWPLSSSHSSSSSIGQYFDKFDVKETSYHLLISRLEIHVCDECQTRGKVSGGAIQLTFHRITLDYYPSHRAGQSCTHWYNFSSAMGTCEQWLQDLADERHANQDLNINMFAKMSSTQHEQLNSERPSSSSLYSRCALIRVDDMNIHQVSSSGQTPQKPPLLSCHRLPKNCSAVHIQYIEYYCLPGDILPVPSPALYIQLHGLLLYVAAQSVLWLNFFIIDLSKHLQQFAAVSMTVREGTKEDTNVRLDGFNLKISFPVPPPSYSPPERPSFICAHLSTFTLTNTRQAPGSTLELLQNTFRSFAAHATFHYPPGPLHPVFVSHVYPSSDPPKASLWSLHSPGMSCFFEGGVPKHQLFLHPLPFTAWTCLLIPEAKLQVMFSVEDTVQLQLNHYHYLTILRFQEHLKILIEGLLENSDLNPATKMAPPCPTTVCVGLLIPAVTITILLPGSSFPFSPTVQENSGRNSLVVPEGSEDNVGVQQRISMAKSTTNGALLDTELGQESQHKYTVQQEKPLQLCQQSNSELVEEIPEVDLNKKVVAHDDIPEKEVSVDLLLGKEVMRENFFSTLNLTRETFNLGKERMQRFLSDTKHKDTDVSHNQRSSPLCRTESFDTVSIDGFDLLSLDSETTENFILNLDAEIAINGDTTSTDQDDSSQSTDGPEAQQILTLALHNASSLLRVCGDDVSLTLQAMDITCAKKSHDVNGFLANTPDSPSSPRLTLNFDLGPTAAYLSPLAVHNGFLQLSIQDFNSEIPVSALTHIGPFLEDEQIPEILPMSIQVSNSKIIIMDDGPRVYPSPILPEPVAFTVQNLKLQRQEDGVFCLAGHVPGSLHINTESKLPDSKEELQRELLAARAKLEHQKIQEQLLLQEIRKYNPQFHL